MARPPLGGFEGEGMGCSYYFCCRILQFFSTFGTTKRHNPFDPSKKASGFPWSFLVLLVTPEVYIWASSKMRATYGHCRTHAFTPTRCTQCVGVSAKAEQRFLQRRGSAKNHSCLKVKLYMHLILVTVITFSMTNISSLICGWQAMFQVCQSPDIARAVFRWYILIRFVECERWSCQHRFMAPPYMSENENIFRSNGVIFDWWHKLLRQCMSLKKIKRMPNFYNERQKNGLSWKGIRLDRGTKWEGE